MELEDYKNFGNWVSSSVLPFLKEYLPAKHDEFRDYLNRLLDVASSFDRTAAVCFLGKCGVGKSTLINALVTDGLQVTPAGGLGPLTAKPLSVSFSETPFFRASYHDRGYVENIRLSLERRHKKQFGEFNSDGDSKASKKKKRKKSRRVKQKKIQLDTRTSSHVPSVAGIGVDEDHEKEYYKKACQLVRGNQSAELDLKYLIDAIREICDLGQRYKSSFSEEDQEHISRVKTSLGTEVHKQGSVEDADFCEDLHLHVAGCLVPIIDKFELGWPSDVLNNGTVIVDLPGVGIATDTYRRETDEWVRSRARCIVLVVDSRGVDDASATLLRDSGFLNRLIYSADDPEKDFAILVVAVTRIDDIASENYRNAKNSSAAGKRPRRRKQDFFLESAEKCKSIMREHVREQLEALGKSQSEDTEKVDGSVAQRILASLKVVPVSAVEYRKILEDDEDETPFLKDVAATGIPELRQVLKQVTQDWRTTLARQRASLGLRIVLALDATLQVCRAEAQQKSLAKNEAEELQRRLADFVHPFRDKLRNQRVLYGEFFRRTRTEGLDNLVEKAIFAAQSDIRGYVKGLKTSHWGTIRAAVRRGGRFDGATSIDLPVRFALCCERPIAAQWGEQILKGTRTQNARLARCSKDTMDSVVAWIRKSFPHAALGVAEAKQSELDVQAQVFRSLGTELVDDARELVKNRLKNALENSIREACQEFVDQRQDRGAGVKNRMLDLFEELAEQVFAMVRQPASECLGVQFAKLESESKAFAEKLADPVEVAETIVVPQDQTQDQGQTKALLAAIDAVESQKPTPIIEKMQLIYESSPDPK